MKRQATELLADLAKDREPTPDVETCEFLQAKMSLLEGIMQGERAIEEGRTVSHEVAKQRMSRWLK